MTPAQASKIAATLSGLYPNNKLSPDSASFYHLALQDIAYEVVMGMVPAIMEAHPTFCPGPAELRAFVHKVTQPDPSWALAWGEAFRQVTSVGSWGAPVFADSALADTVRSLGWLSFCSCPAEGRDRSFFQTRFREIYESAVARRANQATLESLPEPTRMALDRRSS